MLRPQILKSFPIDFGDFQAEADFPASGIEFVVIQTLDDPNGEKLAFREM